MENVGGDHGGVVHQVKHCRNMVHKGSGAIVRDLVVTIIFASWVYCNYNTMLHHSGSYWCCSWISSDPERRRVSMSNISGGLSSLPSSFKLVIKSI
jgi:hypothetical protein